MTLIRAVLLEWMDLKAQLQWVKRGWMGGEKGERWRIETTLPSGHS